MKNYTYGWKIKELGFEEVPQSQYTEREEDRKNYIVILSFAISQAKCGWDGVDYKLMKNANGDTREYMVLYTGDHGQRWIPIEGNSKGCIFSVLGENIW